MTIINLDFETCSMADLKRTGAWKYSLHPSTRAIVVAWSIDGGPIRSAVNFDFLPNEIIKHINAGATIRGWNLAFEHAILTNVFGLSIKPEQLDCTMARSLFAGGPADLDHAGPALKLGVTKDKQGHALMLRMSKPRSTDPLRWWHLEDPERLERLRKYCERDVEVEMLAANMLPPLPPFEREIFNLDRKANDYGVQIDFNAIDRFIAIASDATKLLNEEAKQITNGCVTNAGTQTDKLLSWLGEYAPPSLKKDDVAAALKRDDLPQNKRRLLEIRQLVAKASVKKLNAMKACADDAGIVRGLLQYCGAGRTHRAAGRLIQVQNFPRPSIKDPDKAIDHILRGMDINGITAFHGQPLETVASCLRGMLIPRKDHVFIDYDLSSIEARVVAWISKQNDILKVFERNEDVYAYTQKRLGLPSRQAGKCCVLGLNYNMGPNKFIATAETYGLKYTEDEAIKIVADYREANNKIRSLWYRMDEAAKDAIATAQKTHNKSAQIKINEFLEITVRPAKNDMPLMLIKMPSGNHLFYRNVRLEEGDRGNQIAFDGIDQKTRTWGPQRSYGGKLVENLTQSIARDIMMDMLLRIERANVGRIITSVHDQVLLEASNDNADRAQRIIHDIMNTPPAWAQGCPIAAEGGIKHRFGK